MPGNPCKAPRVRRPVGESGKQKVENVFSGKTRRRADRVRNDRRRSENGVDAADRKELSMKTEVRKERMKKYGSILYCPAQDCKCFGRDTDEECRHEKCLLQDPEYIALQEKIEKKRRARR